MLHRSKFSPPCLSLLVVLSAILVAFTASAQQPKAAAPKGYRKLGPGAETIIPAKPDPQDTVTQHDMVEIQSSGAKLDWKPATQAATETLGVKTKDIPFRRGASYLQFAFKPLRVMYVDIPAPGGHLDRRQIWYMVYRVTNFGEHLDADSNSKDGKSQIATGVPPSNEEVFFHPQFVLESQKYGKAYLDRVLPLAVEAIEKREDPRRHLLNSAEMSEQPIPLSTPGNDRSVWGVATWEHVDPRIDYFSIYVKGLSSAYRFKDPEGAYNKNGEPGNGRIYAQKTLKLNFWRPGDDREINESDIYFGIPGQVDHEWVFR